MCRRDGTVIGTVERLMIAKVSGHVAYAVVKIATSHGSGERRFPLAWDLLHYDRRRGAYQADVTEDEIRSGANLDSAFDWGMRNDVAHIRPYRPPTFWGSSF